MLGYKGVSHQAGLTLGLEPVKHYSLTAAAGHRPGWPDEQPDEGLGLRGPEALGQAQIPRRHSATQISTTLLAE